MSEHQRAGGSQYCPRLRGLNRTCLVWQHEPAGRALSHRVGQLPTTARARRRCVDPLGSNSPQRVVGCRDDEESCAPGAGYLRGLLSGECHGDIDGELGTGSDAFAVTASSPKWGAKMTTVGEITCPYTSTPRVWRTQLVPGLTSRSVPVSAPVCEPFARAGEAAP